MVIFWRGMGILALILPVGLGLLCRWIFKSDTAGNIGLIIGGALVFLIGLGAMMPSDEEKQQGVKTKMWHHTFFFLPMFLWGLAAIGGGIYLLVK